jgi:type I restriction enzyme S subunit
MSTVESHDIWLAKIPADWQRSRIRNVAQLSPGYSAAHPEPDEPCVVVPMELLSDDGKMDVTNQQPFRDVTSGLTMFEAKDVLFAKITPCMENGKGVFVPVLPTRYAFGSTEFHVLRPTNKIDGAFLYYATYNPVYRAYAAENMVGAAGQKRVSTRFVKDTRLFLPRLPEQRRIVEYLNVSCTAIDTAIAAKHRQLQTLDAVRESLIESAVTKGTQPSVRCRRINEDWIGEIPEHWDACRIKRVVSQVDYGISESSEPEGKFPVLKMGNIQGGEIVMSKIEFVTEVSKCLLLEKGDLLYNRTNSPDQVGKAAVFRGSKADGITFASYLVRLRTNHRADPYFLNYLLNSNGFLAFARRLAIPSVQQSNLNSTRYCRIMIPLPPRKEQVVICAYLDDKLSAMKRIVTSIQTQIATLTDYRKSLIHECVTGQRRITEADLNHVKAHG